MQRWEVRAWQWGSIFSLATQRRSAGSLSSSWWKQHDATMRPRSWTGAVAVDWASTTMSTQRRHQYSVNLGGIAAAVGAADAFERYSEIDNSNEKRIQAIRALGLDKDEWIATEKVHGANFGMYSLDHGKTPVRFAKRSGIMPPNEHFFGYHVLLPELLAHMQKIRQLVTERIVKATPHTVIVNGELFGGKYTHPNVPRSKQTFVLGGKPRGISAVQTDSFPQYSPNLHFYAFDIKYRMKADDAAVVTLTYDEAHGIFEQVPGLLFAKAIVRGPMAKVAAFDVEAFQTTIPALVGMGNFPLKGNWSEGLVVKHAKRGTVGWEPKGPTILKFKCVAFQEISTDRRQGPRVDQMEQVRKDSIARSGVQLPALASTIHDPPQLEAALHLLDHVTVNRLKNVVSKIGSAPFASRAMMPQQLADLVAQDAMKDFLKEADDSIVVKLSIAIRREMARHLLFECRRLVNEQWKTIVAEKLDAEESSKA